MAGSASFLTPEDREQYERADRLRPRMLRETAGYGVNPKAPRTCETAAYFRERLAGLSRYETAWFEAACVVVRRDDGMTWSAETLRRAIESDYGHFDVPCVGSRLQVDELPMLVARPRQRRGAALLARSDFLSLAVKHGLAPATILSRRWVWWLVALVAVAFAGLFEYSKISVKAGLASGLPQASWFWPAVAVLALGVFSVASQYVIPLVRERQTPAQTRALVERILAEQGGQTVTYGEFVDGLAHTLAHGKCPRFVIVDHFEELDTLSRDVIQRYLDAHSEHAAGAEYWVVFEGEDGPRLSTAALQNQGRPGWRRTIVLEQQFLSDKEKATLAQAAGTPANAIFTTARAVAGQRTDTRWIETLVSEYRRRQPRRPERYDALDFLYFVSVNSASGLLPIPVDFLAGRLAADAPLRRAALQAALPGTQCHRREFAESALTAQRAFSSVLVVADQPGGRTIAAKPEAADWLQRHHAEWTSLDSSRVHLLWSLFWFDWLRDRPLEAYWIRALARWLDGVTQETDLPVTRAIADMLLYLIDACMQVCLFSEIPPLTRRLRSLATGVLRDDQSLIKRTRRACWKSYCLLGDEESLQTLLETQSAGGREPAPVPTATAWSHSGAVFLACMTDAGNAHAALDPTALLTGIKHDDRIDTVLDHMAIRGAWLALVGLPLFGEAGPFPHAILALSAREATAGIESLVSRAMERAEQTTADALRPVDLANLCLGFWCWALTFRLDVRVRLLPLAVVDGTATPEILLHALDPDQELDKLASWAGRAVSLAATTRSRGSASSAFDYVSQGLARELAVDSIAAVVAAVHAVHAATPQGPSQRMAEALRGIEEALGHPLAEEALGAFSDSSPDLRDRLDHLLALSSVVWDLFGLARFSEDSCLRRVELTALFHGSAYVPDEASAEMVNCLSAALNARGLSGILARFVIAELHGGAAELVSHYVHEATQLALANRAGARLREDLLLMSLVNSGLPSATAQQFLDELLRPTDGDQPLSRYLESVPAQMLPGTALRLLGTAQGVRDTTVQQRVVETLRKRAASDDAAIRDQVEDALGIFALRNSARSATPLDAREALKPWSSRTDSWCYAAALGILQEAGQLEGSLATVCARVLDRDPREDSFNAWFLLATGLATRLMHDREHAALTPTVVRYLKVAIGRWEKLSTVDLNLSAYQALATLDKPAAVTHRLNVERWMLIKVERDHLRRFPQLAQQWEYFLIFSEYFRSARFWGLAPDISDERFARVGDEYRRERVARVRDWKNAGAHVPDPLVRCDYTFVVSSEFALLGDCLFRAPLDDDPAFQVDRMAFNDAARRALPQLIATITCLPSLPPGVSELIRRYQDRLFQFARPSA